MKRRRESLARLVRWPLTLASALAVVSCGELEPGELETSGAAVKVKPGSTLPNGAVVPPPGTPYRVAPKRAKPSVNKPSKRSPSSIYSPTRYTPRAYVPPRPKQCHPGYMYAYNGRVASHQIHPGAVPLGWACVEKCRRGYSYRHKQACVENCRKGSEYAATSNTVSPWKCVSCPKGFTFAHGQTCIKCPKGFSYAFYQPHRAWRCVKCPKAFPNYYHKRDCVADCPPGYEYLFDKPPYAEGPLGSYTLTYQCLYAKKPAKKKKKKKK